MEYRPFGKLGFDVSTFGMGCMRLPTITQEDGKKVIDEPEAIAMIRHAIDSGVTYIDTAYVYHDQTSEIVVGKALKDGYREKVCVADKLPLWLCETYEDMEKRLDEMLERLQTDHLDFLLLHSLFTERFEFGKKLECFRFLDEAKASGKILHAGFSMHDNLNCFKEILDSYPFEMCQIQLNFLDDQLQAGVEGLKYAAEKGVPVVIMEPLKGGKLAGNIPEEAQKLWDSYPEKRSPVEWAFRWLYNFPEVTVILSGVSTMDQLNDNLRIFENSKANVLSDADKELIAKVKAVYQANTKIGCTGCAYCMPCPQGVHIPDCFVAYNDSIADADAAKARYGRIIESKQDASACAQCGLCESLCPQHLPIIETLQALDKELR